MSAAQKRQSPVSAGLVESKGNNTADFNGKIGFFETDNPRHLRAIQALRVRPVSRENLDSIAGCSNGPDLVAELRRRGLEIPCERAKKIDRDLFAVYPGVYYFTQKDHRLVNRWLKTRKGATS